jgi:hypothetical protein
MENMKSLADQLREQLVKPQDKNEVTAKPDKKVKLKAKMPEIMAAIVAYDNSLNKSMVHVRFDEKTVRTMNQFKLATGIDVTKLVSFAVKQLLENHPEIKQMIKQFLQNSEL